MNYTTFQFDYDKDKLMSLFQTLSTQTQAMYNIADLTNVDKTNFPMMNIFNRDLSINEYGLAELTSETGMHENPKNNGLIMFPVNGLISFTFEDQTSVDITQPTILNGKVFHTYLPKETPAVFFAIKIPSNISYEQCCLLPKN
jgi:hypothetical protein